MKFLGLAAAAAFAVSATVASAATVNVTYGDLDAYGEVDTSQGALLPAGATWDPVRLDGYVRTGSVDGKWRSPYDLLGTGNFETLEYFSVGPSTSQPATLSFGQEMSALSILWGSVDTYNTIEFLLGGVVQDAVDGAAVLAFHETTEGGGGAALVNITDVRFDSLKFWSQNANGTAQNAFEFANLRVAPVPLPAGGLLLLAGLGGLALVRRRKNAA